MRSLPLFLLAAVFFVSGAVLRWGYPAYALYGPGVFTFWALLLALGFTCTIGAVVSWTLAGDTVSTPSENPRPAPAPNYLPIELPESEASEGPAVPPAAARGRTEYGRPAPAVLGAVSSGDWYEGPTDSERFSGPEYMIPVDLPPTPELEEGDPAEYEPVEKVLADLERIERELAPRARAVEPTSS